jgi:hypothetical protein
MLATSKPQVKWETTVSQDLAIGRLKATESPGRGSPRYVADASLVCYLCGDQPGRG